MRMTHTGPPLSTPPVMARGALAILAILATMGIVVLLTVADPALSRAVPVTLQGDQRCVRTTCLDRDLRVTTYQPQPDQPSAPPAAVYTGR